MPADTKQTTYFTRSDLLYFQALFDILKSDGDQVLPKLNEYFPRTGFEHPRAVS